MEKQPHISHSCKHLSYENYCNQNFIFEGTKLEILLVDGSSLISHIPQKIINGSSIGMPKQTVVVDNFITS
jgi:hypothetical protein